jgi:hypothetical protein
LEGRKKESGLRRSKSAEAELGWVELSPPISEPLSISVPYSKKAPDLATYREAISYHT